MYTETQTLLINQVSKIFGIIEKNLDNVEICKIAIETLSNKCLESPIFIFPILENLLEVTAKGGLRIVEDASMLIEGFFDDFSPKIFQKIITNEIFKSKLISICNELPTFKSNTFVFNHSTFNIDNIEEIKFVPLGVFSNFEIDNFEYLYSKDNDMQTPVNNGVLFTKMEMKVLFPNDDEMRKEVEEGMKSVNKTNKNKNDSHIVDNSNQNKIIISDFYKQYAQSFLISSEEKLNVGGVKPQKKRKVASTNNGSIQTEYEIYINPFYTFFTSLLEYNCGNYTSRLCSTSLLTVFHKYFNKSYFSFFPVRISLIDKETISSINVSPAVTFSSISSKIQRNLLTQLISNAILDKVVDYTNVDFICISKEMNMKLASAIIESPNDDEIVIELTTQMMGLLNSFARFKKDWQPLFAVLTLVKYLVISPSATCPLIINQKDLFSLPTEMMKSESEDILNLCVIILDKVLSINLSSPPEKRTLSIEEVSQMFFVFIKLISRYDDIESGVRYYFNCLSNFVFFFLDETKDDLTPIFSELNIALNSEFIIHSMNKLVSVRIKYFEVINGLLVGGKGTKNHFIFPPDFIEKNVLIAYQGFCLEEDKVLLKTMQAFLMNVLITNPNNVIIFEKHKERLIALLLTYHINSLNNFYIPSSSTLSHSELEEVYRSFFVNSMETDAINKAYERKLFYIIPILSLILKLKVDFIETIYEMFEMNNVLILRRKLLLILKIYLYYLEFIECEPNKTLIISDDNLKFLSENATMNEMPLRVSAKNIENIIGVALTLFSEFTNQRVHVKNEIKKRLTMIIIGLKTERNLNLNELNTVMKLIYDEIKSSGDNQGLKLCCEHIKNVKEALTAVEKSQNIPLLRHKIRGYASACLFVHSIYTNAKYPKISSIANAFLNCLKLNCKETKLFVKYILKLSLTLENMETITKIIVTFIENSIKAYNERTEEDIKQFVFLPIKYFFGEFSKFQKFEDIQKIFTDYENSLINSKTEFFEMKIIILLYLLCPIKGKLFCYHFDKMKNILRDENIEKMRTIKNITNLISSIVINSEKLFINYTQKEFLDFLFNQIDLDSKSLEINIFILQILDLVLQDNKLSTMSIDFIFISLKYINHKKQEIRSLATSIFSKQMKIISMLKFDSNYDQISTSTSSKSLEFITKIFTQNIFDIKELKVNLKEKLRTYQLIGVNWLLFLGSFGLGLALCDDMGLGKTIQTLVTIVHSSIEHREKTGNNPVSLIVCPATLILNWILECKKFFSEEDVTIIQPEIGSSHGPFYIGNQIKKREHKNKVTIYITNYEKVRENLEDMFTNREFFYLVLDEAHIVKNPKTKLYQSIRKINAERRIILTGTPIQNNVMELWSLFDFLMPGFLGNENDFEIKYHKKIHSNIKKLNLEEKLQENIFQTSLTEIRKRIKPFVLRRLKSDVLQELPEKIISDYNCEMTQGQREIYSKWEKMFEQPNHSKDSQFTIIDKLRKICNHPLLLGKEVPASNQLVSNGSGKLKSLEELLVSLGFESSSSNTPSSNTSLTYENKVLIFTQYKQMCSILASFFKEKFPSMNILLLTSDTKVSERGNIVNRFNSDPSINLMILTTTIGGLGLNLTSANIVVMYDHNWNPMKDMQAIDRAHRIGQKKTVQVFRLITVKSIEEKLISLQTFKKYIANNVVNTDKVSDSKVNANTVMESFEEFSMNKITKKTNNGNKKKEGKKKTSKLDELTRENEEDEKRDEMEVEYLKKLLEQK